MGREATCTVRMGRKRAEGKALLETAEILFRGGDLKLAIPFRDIRSLEARGRLLTVTTAEGAASFELGTAEAEKWAEKIRNPKRLIEKLGVKPGLRVSVLGIRDADFTKDLAQWSDDVSNTPPKRDCDLVFFGISKLTDLAKLEGLRHAIRSDGAIWVVWAKGRSELNENHIRASAKTLGLVDIKVAAFSETHSALKLVIPVAKRLSER